MSFQYKNCIDYHNDIEIIPKTQKELDIISVSNVHFFTDFHNSSEIVAKMQNDLDVVSIKKLH